MSETEGSAAPGSGTSTAFADITDDPEIAALLDFEPVPRARTCAAGWSPEVQRHYVAELARLGSQNKAAGAVGMDGAGASKLYRANDAESYRAAVDAARALFQRRVAERRQREQRRRLAPSPSAAVAAPPSPARGQGQVLNEHGEYEDEESYRQRGDEAMDSISAKMRNARRLFLEEIAPDPAKRAAFEILTEFKIDWDKAARREAQIDEPYRKPRMREPDMLLTAENGWLGEFMHGPDRKAELLGEINAWRAERGLDPVVWEGE